MRVHRGEFSRFFFVLDDEGDAAVGGILGGIGLAQGLNGETAHLRDLVSANAMGLYQTARSVGAVGREFPVGVQSARGILLRVGVAVEGDISYRKAPTVRAESTNLC